MNYFASYKSECIFAVLNVYFFLSRDKVISLQASLVRATYVAKSGKPNYLNTTDWVKISCELPQYAMNCRHLLFLQFVNQDRNVLSLFIEYQND